MTNSIGLSMVFLFTASASYMDYYDSSLIGIIAKVEQWTAYIKLINRAAVGHRDCTMFKANLISLEVFYHGEVDPVR